MITHRQAREIVSSVAPGLTPAESLAVRCVAWHETNYGFGWKVPNTNNWGAITKGMPCDDATGFVYSDSRPDGQGGVITYQTCFRRYPTPEAGALDVVKVALKPNVRTAIMQGRGLRGVAEEMYRNGYYTGISSRPENNIAAYASALNAAKEVIIAATGETDPFPDSNGGRYLPSPPLPTLRIGMQGDAVMALRLFFGLRGDIFDAELLGLVVSLQRARSLEPDGIVGAKTWHVITTRERKTSRP